MRQTLLSQNHFLKQLQQEARWQGALQQERLMPKAFGQLSSYVAWHNWQVCFLLALLTTGFFELFHLLFFLL
jgi:hypothetical protein